MKIESLRIIRSARGEERARWAMALADPAWQAGAKTLKEDRGAWVRRGRINGTDVVIKCRPLEGGWARGKCARGYGRGDRHWRGAATLAAKKVPTARPLVLAQGRVEGNLCEMLVLESLSGQTLLEAMAANAGRGGTRLAIKQQHALAAEVGGQVG